MNSAVIPVDLFREIQSLSFSLDYCNWMNSSQKLFRQVKYETVCFRFPIERVNEPEIRAIIVKLEEKMGPKTSINSLKYYYNSIITKYDDIEKLFRDFPFPISFIDYSSIIELTFDQLKSLFSCPHNSIKMNRLSLPSLAGLDLRVSKLFLEGCPVLNTTTGLSHLKELKLSYCRCLVDVSHLRSLKKVEIRNCQALSNLTGLGSVHD